MAALLLFGPVLATPGSKYLCIESAANLHDSDGWPQDPRPDAYVIVRVAEVAAGWHG